MEKNKMKRVNWEQLKDAVEFLYVAGVPQARIAKFLQIPVSTLLAYINRNRLTESREERCAQLERKALSFIPAGYKVILSPSERDDVQGEIINPGEF